MPCSACGWNNPAHSRFCNQCGVAQGPAAPDSTGASAPSGLAATEAAAPAALADADGVAPAGRAGVANPALAAPPVPPNGVEAELRRLAERVERLEQRLAPDGDAPLPARGAPEPPTPRWTEPFPR